MLTRIIYTFSFVFSFFLIGSSYIGIPSRVQTINNPQSNKYSACFSRRVFSLHLITSRSDRLVSDSLSRPPQLLEFVEPTTNVSVILVGAMHYNPTSISLTADTVSKLASVGKLGSVIIESCETRWNRTQTIQSTDTGKALKNLLNNEMRTASDIASNYKLPVILGDQCINETNKRIGAAAKQTIMDLLSPFAGGWARLYNDVAQASVLSLPSGPDYLGPTDFLDSRLLLAAPVSLFRYPLAFLVKAPITGTLVLSVLALFAGISWNGAGDSGVMFEPDRSLVDSVSEWATSAALFGLEVAVLSRVFLVVILAERNEVLARSILLQCERIRSAKETETSTAVAQQQSIKRGNVSTGMFSFDSLPSALPSLAVGTQRESSSEKAPSTKPLEGTMRGDMGDKSVVAVLGMAHCNGVMKLLKEQLIGQE